MAHGRINIIESTSGLVPSGIEVNSDSLDDDATVDRVVRNLAILWNIVAVEAES